MMPTRVAPAGSTTAFACEDTIHLRHTGATPVDCSLSCRHYRLNASLPQHSECDRDFAKQCPLSTPTGRGLETSAQLDAARLLTRTLAAAFARHNVSYWLDFGALAGSVRYGGQAIAARGQIDDVDIGVLLHEHAAVDAASGSQPSASTRPAPPHPSSARAHQPRPAPHPADRAAGRDPS